jgi:hypothetical protein
MRNLLIGGVVALAAITFAPITHADPDPNTEIVGNAGGGELPLPVTPGDGIGPGGALPPDFLLPPGPLPDSLGPAAPYSSLEDPA